MKSNDHLNRRDLGRSAIGLGAALGVPSVSVGAPSGTLPRRQLGKTGVDVSLLGIGTVPFGLEEMTQETVNEVVDAAIEAGINYFDVAPDYGLAERLGVALKGKREKVFLVSKVEATSARDARWYVR